MASLNVSFKINDRSLKTSNAQIRKGLARANADALNAYASKVRKAAHKRVAMQLNLDVAKINGRYNIDGKRKGLRAPIRKARVVNPRVVISAYMRGLPLTTPGVGQKQIKSGRGRTAGIKAKGGRFYESVFYSKSKKYAFKRRSSNRQLMVPKIGLRDAMTAAYDHRWDSPRGNQLFRTIWDREMRRQIRRIESTGGR